MGTKNLWIDSSANLWIEVRPLVVSMSFQLGDKTYLMYTYILSHGLPQTSNTSETIE